MIFASSAFNVGGLLSIQAKALQERLRALNSYEILFLVVCQMTDGHQVLLENGIEDELKPVRVVHISDRESPWMNLNNSMK